MIAIETIVPVSESLVVAEIPCGLLEVTHEPTPLEHLGQDVARLFTGQVDAAELGDRVVAVLEEDLLVEVVRAREPDRCVDGHVAREVEVTDELVEKESAQTLRRPRVPGEECSFDDLGQVDQGEDRAL